MHEAVTSPTQPCDAIQFPLLMPPPLQHFGVRFFRDQMMIRQRNPTAFANLACRGTCAGPLGWCGGGGADVLGENGG